MKNLPFYGLFTRKCYCYSKYKQKHTVISFHLYIKEDTTTSGRTPQPMTQNQMVIVTTPR